MKKQELRGLIEQHLALRRQMDDLREELRELEARYAEVGQLLYWYRSMGSTSLLLLYLEDIKGNTAKTTALMT